MLTVQQESSSAKAVNFLSKLECSFSLQSDCQSTAWSRLSQGFLGLNTSEQQSQHSRVCVLI